MMFVVLILENVMLMGEVGHHVTPFSGTPLCRFAQLERRLRYQKDFALELVLKCLQFQ